MKAAIYMAAKNYNFSASEAGQLPVNQQCETADAPDNIKTKFQCVSTKPFSSLFVRTSAIRARAPTIAPANAS